MPYPPDALNGTASRVRPLAMHRSRTSETMAAMARPVPKPEKQADAESIETRSAHRPLQHESGHNRKNPHARQRAA